MAAEPVDIPLPTSPPVDKAGRGSISLDAILDAAAREGHDTNDAAGSAHDAVGNGGVEPLKPAVIEVEPADDTEIAQVDVQDPTATPIPQTHTFNPPEQTPRPEDSAASLVTQSNVSQNPEVAPPPPEKQNVNGNGLRHSNGAAATGHKRSNTIGRGASAVSVVLISSALETIAASKEARRSPPLKESTENALNIIKADRGGDNAREIFEPLRLACETRSEKLMIASLDCISKLISHSFFADASHAQQALQSPPLSPHPGASQASIHSPSLVDLVVHTITSCHSEATPETVSLQIVKALLSLILSSTIFVHHSSLLKAVRTVYNVFLLSNDPMIQNVAQVSLTQMVDHVFNRCKAGVQNLPLEQTWSMGSSGSVDGSASPRSSASGFRRGSVPTSLNGIARAIAEQTDAGESTISLSLPTPGHPESPAPQDASSNADSESNAGRESSALPRQSVENGQDGAKNHEEYFNHRPLTETDLFLKDAFLVFRALCKLTMKPLNNESERDLKSHAMRSKLLSLHLVLHILELHMSLISDPRSVIYSSSSAEVTQFVQAVNPFICVCISRNAVSPVLQVYELSVEIFWRVLSGMRTKMKNEIHVLLHEIFIPILEMRSSTLKQKAIMLGMFSRLCQDPQALVDIYLNYDCDEEVQDNIFESLMNIIKNISTATITVNAQKAPETPSHPANAPGTKGQNGSHVPPSLSTTALSVPGSMDTSGMGLSEQQLKRQGLECMVTVLRSLVTWGTMSGSKSADDTSLKSALIREDGRRDSVTGGDNSLDPSLVASVENLRQQTPEIEDDPTRFESAKQKKIALLEGVRKFNFKPKNGIKYFLEGGFIPSKSPHDIAAFLLSTEGLSKAMIGEYMGEGDEENIAVMHAFVDQLDLKNQRFVDALRNFLQSFRLPGEAQKIDRYMLKFAERYIAGNNDTPFTNADTAYILAYSTVLLNTDAHSPQVKKRMTKEDFIKNNRGINDGADLPEDLLTSIFDEIQSNEIRMKDEIETAPAAPAPASLTTALANVGRDLQKEAYVLQTSGMANKTEALFKTIIKTQKKGSRDVNQFFSASHFVHVRSMFQVLWGPFLFALSSPLQGTDDLEIVQLCLDGFKSAIRIVCFFDMGLERDAFVTTLAKFTFLNNLGEMKTKNMEAIKTLLDVAVTEGNSLKSSWHEVLTCVSQLEHMQLISAGVDVEAGKKGKSRKLPNEELANESRSTHITVAADMVFSLSRDLSGTAIVEFVQALCNVSWQEISSSGLSKQPRLFSLQKLVEISYYNMNRIRLEWSNIWDILGEHFNQVCCHNNPNVGFFALDSLRQLAKRFLEKEELPHFKFQKDFLKPFEHTMINNANPEIRDMVLQCLQQMVQANVQNLRSGWRTMFGVFQAASRVLTERIATSAFEIVTRLNKEHFNSIIRHGAFADLTVCITEFCKVSKYQKISLLAIAMLRGVVPVMLECAECRWPPNPSTLSLDDHMIKYWYPVLFAFYDIIMNGEDLEVRRLALDSLFTTLKTYGRTWPVEFWDTVCRELLFPIFSVLKSSQDLSRFNTQEDMSVWLSTTMIQALRDLIDLYTFFFDILERFIDGLLDLLCVCICQENDTLARIGTSCLQQLLENNVEKLSAARWQRVVTAFVSLFKTTTPHQLFDDSLRAELDGNTSPDATDESSGPILPAPLPANSDQPEVDQRMSYHDRRRIFKQIIVKCVLQLLLIETTNDLLRSESIYETIPPDQMLRLMGVLDHSYQFARMFNDDKELRTGLWKVGFMKHLPNLLKQESSSAATLVHILLRMYYDPRPEHQNARPQIADRLLPLGLGVIADYNKLRVETQGKNIVAWTPVVAEILEGFSRFDERTFKRYLPAIYPLVTDLLSRDMAPEVRLAVKAYMVRVGHTQGIVEQISS